MIDRRHFMITGLAASGMTLTGRSALANDAGLGIILVGASWCPWCHGAAEQLAIAAGQWGWPILIASLDNTPIPPFEDFIEASNHPLTVDINRLPTTLIVAPKDNHIVSAFEGYKGPAPYLSRIANTLEAYQSEVANG